MAGAKREGRWPWSDRIIPPGNTKPPRITVFGGACRRTTILGPNPYNQGRITPLPLPGLNARKRKWAGLQARQSVRTSRLDEVVIVAQPAGDELARLLERIFEIT